MWPTTKCVAPRWSTSFSARCSGPRRPISSRIAASASQPGIAAPAWTRATPARSSIATDSAGSGGRGRRARRARRPASSRAWARASRRSARRRARPRPPRGSPRTATGAARRPSRRRRPRRRAAGLAGAGGSTSTVARGVAQRLRHPGELGRRLALDAHRDEERARLHRADLAGEQRRRRHARLFEGQRAAAARPGPDRLDDRPEARVAGAPEALGRVGARPTRRRLGQPRLIALPR